MFKTASLRFSAMFCGLLLTTACAAASSDATATYADGNQYVTLPAPHQRFSDSGKVEVVEVFSYGCIHCADFSPYADELRKTLPKGVEFKELPAPFNDTWVPFARAYYAAKELDRLEQTHCLEQKHRLEQKHCLEQKRLLEQTHDALFVAKFKEQYPINSMDEIADFYAKHGANRAKFLQIANSPEVEAKIKRDLKLLQAWGVDGTPTIVVNGTYRSHNVKSYKELMNLTKWLAQQALNATHQ